MKASLLFITYNHAPFIARAIRSAMAQDHPDLELVICEDASSDSTLAILKDELRHCPPHIPVVWASSSETVGLIANFNRGMAACTGDVIIPMSGDDISEPRRASTLAKVFADNPRCMLAISDCMRTDEQDRILAPSCIHAASGIHRHGKHPKKLHPIPTSGATAAYRSALRDFFGPLSKHPYAEDTCYGLRGFLSGDVHFVAEPLVQCRAHETNLCNVRTGRDTPERRRRHLRMLRALLRDARQWHADIHLAQAQGMVAPDTGQIVSALANELFLQSRLARHSLTNAPWPVWRETARRLLAGHPSGRNVRKAARALMMRLSQSSKNRYWRKRFIND